MQQVVNRDILAVQLTTDGEEIDVLQLVEYPLYHCSCLRSKEEVGIYSEVLRLEGFKLTPGET